MRKVTIEDAKVVERGLGEDGKPRYMCVSGLLTYEDTEVDEAVSYRFDNGLYVNGQLVWTGVIGKPGYMCMRFDFLRIEENDEEEEEEDYRWAHPSIRGGSAGSTSRSSSSTG